MNEQLIKFIELCLEDGVISEKEREVIFRKSTEFGVPEDECEIILEGMIQKLGKKESSNHKSDITESVDETKLDTSSKENKVDFTDFISNHKIHKGVFGQSFIMDSEKTLKSVYKWTVEDKVKESIKQVEDKIKFRFRNSFVVGEDFLVSMESGHRISLNQINDLEIKDGGVFSTRGLFLGGEHFGEFFDMNDVEGKELFFKFKDFINQSLNPKEENNNTENSHQNTTNPELEQTNDSIDKIDLEPEIPQEPIIEKDVQNQSNDEKNNSQGDYLTDTNLTKDIPVLFEQNKNEILNKIGDSLKSIGGLIQEDFLYDKNKYKRSYKLKTQKYRFKEYRQINVSWFIDYSPISLHIDVLIIINSKENKYIKYYPFLNKIDDIPENTFPSLNTYCFKFWDLIREIRRSNPKVEIDIQLLKVINNLFNPIIKEYNQEIDRMKSVNSKKLLDFDSDNNGVVDILETGEDFMKLVEKKQSEIIKIDQSMIQKFVRLNDFLESYRNEISGFFNTIQNELDSEFDRQQYLKVMGEWFNDYQELLLHSLSMLVSLTDGQNMVTYYKIYEVFDKMNVFNSNWENELSSKLDSIDNRLKSMVESNNRISQQIRTLTYVTQSSFENLGNNISRELKSIDSSIKFNNLLTTVQTYQLYKVNKNTKGLKG